MPGPVAGTGPSGPPGGGGGGGSDANYVHTQSSANTVWTVTHNLNKHPSVHVEDSGGSVVWGDVLYVNNNSLTITFAVAFSGKAYCN